jgi:hypothetical protein
MAPNATAAANGEGGDQHHAEGQPQDGRDQPFEGHHARVDRGPVEQRRQQDEQHDLGVDVVVGHARDEGDPEPDHQQQNRRRQSPAQGQSADREHAENEPDDLPQDIHGPIPFLDPVR